MRSLHVTGRPWDYWRHLCSRGGTPLDNGVLVACYTQRKTTGLTGLAVSKNPHHELTVLYNKILRALEKLPQSAAYRRYTEQIVNERLSLVQSEKDIAQLEKRIGAGQIEQVIKQAEGELVLARRMLNWKPWEPLVAKPPAGQWSWPPK